jgi:hypothetical protein
MMSESGHNHFSEEIPNDPPTHAAAVEVGCPTVSYFNSSQRRNPLPQHYNVGTATFFMSHAWK